MTRTRSSVPELDLARIRRYVDARVPSRVAARVRMEVVVRGTTVTIVECRPPWPAHLGPAWSRVPIGDDPIESRQPLGLDPCRQRAFPRGLDLAEVRSPQVRPPALVAGDRGLCVDSSSQLGWVEVPARVDEIEMKVEQVPWLSSLDEGSEFLGDQLDFRDRRHGERLQAQFRDVEQGVADGENEIL